MAKIALCNTIGTNNDPLWFLKYVLKLAGWTVKSSGTGTGGTYSSSSDLITNQGAALGGMGVVRSWYVIEDPAGLRQLCCQTTTAASNQSRVKYSKGAKFIGGTPGANTVPSASDEVVFHGGGTDASPSGIFFPNTTPGNYRIHMVTYTTPVGGVYPVYLYFTTTPGSTQSSGMIVIDPLAPGSYDVSDPEPYIVIFGSAVTTTTPGFYFNGTWTTNGVVNTVIAIGALLADVYSGKDVNVRPIYFTNGSQRIKGYGGYMAARGPARVYPATVNRATDSYVYLDARVLPFEDNLEPGV